MSPAVHAPSKAVRLLSAGALTLSVALVLPRLASGQGTQAEPPPPAIEAPSTQPQVEGETRAPAYIAAVDGLAHLDREGQSETADRGVPLVPGDRLRTEGGRVELAFPNGSQVYLDRYSEVELQDPLSLRVARGRLYVRIASTIDAAERLIVDGPNATVEFQDDGEYRVAVGGTDAAEVELVVLRGQASLASEGGNVLVPQGHRAIARDGAAPTTPEWHNAGQTTLEKWAADRETLWQSGQYASRQYLPAELSDYAGTFDRYGTWQNDETYGAVWYPTSTADNWRPYYDGRWDYSSSYGWTWIASGDVWTYPTHHYGRWNLGGRGWYWIPSRRWGAAWVYWAVASDYVGWCPLGWNGRPVLNVFRYDRTYASRSHDPYRAWTVIPRGSFGRSPVTRAFADRTRLDRDRPAFILQHRGPGIAPPRSPYPSPFNTRLNGRTGTDRTPASGGVSTMSPRSYGQYGSDRDSRGGHAVPRGSASEDDSTTRESPYERARPYMPRPDASPAGDEGNTYRRTSSDESPTRSPNRSWRDRRDRDDDRDEGRAGPGYSGPGYRVRDSPGMSREPERDRSPGMSDPRPGSRHASPRNDPPARRDTDDGDRGDRGGNRDRSPSGGGGVAPRGDGNRDGGNRDSGGSRGGDRGGSRGDSGGGAVRRHP